MFLEVIKLISEMFKNPYIVILTVLGLVVVVSLLLQVIKMHMACHKVITKLQDVRENSIKERAASLNRWFSEEKLPEVLKDCWDNFYSDLKVSKVTPDPYDYFTDYELVHRYGRRKFVESIPAVFLSLGILGTFYGITTGIQTVDSTAPSAQLRQGISDLMDGMEIAFHSSIAGILLSLFIQFIDKLYIYKKLTSSFRSIRNGFDETFPVKTEGDLLGEILEQQNKKNVEWQSFIIKDFLPQIKSDVTESIHHELIPKVNREIELSERQTHLLKDLGDHLKNSLPQRIEAALSQHVSSNLKDLRVFQENQAHKVQSILSKELPQILKEDIIDVYSTTLIPTLEKNNKIMQEMTESTKSVLNDHLSDMVDHFTVTMKTMAGDHMEQLDSILMKTMTWQEKVYGEMGILVENLEESAEKQTSMANSSTELTEKLNSYTEGFFDYQKRVTDSVQEMMIIMEQNKEIQTEAGYLLKNVIEEREQQQKIFSVQTEQTKGVMVGIEDQVDLLIGLQTELSSATDTYKKVEALIDHLERSAEVQESIVDKTVAAFEGVNQFSGELSEHKKEQASFAREISNSTEKQLEVQHEMERLLSSLSQERSDSSNVIHEGISGFRNILNSLKDESELLLSLQEGMKSSIDQHSGSVQAIGALTDSNKTLVDVLANHSEKIKNSSSNLERVTSATQMYLEQQGPLQKEIKSMVEKLMIERAAIEKLTRSEKNILVEQLKQMDKRVDKLQYFWKDNAEQLKKNSNVFSDMNNKLDSSMKQFADHMYQGLNRTFDQFDKELSNSVLYLDRGVNSIRTVVEDMEKDMEKIGETIKSFESTMREVASTQESGENIND
ncbi:hypothetical protein [Guptibacillus hwajinpoensis]|uniref:hypothetical protein n=1 Tax=Guptibacillus hwajinpoensis TaxID=208199 RepID=UPI003D00FEB0